jgi:hypothetical protein
MVFSRSVPQQTAQISPPTPGQYRRARFFSQILQEIFTAVLTPSYHRKMARTDLYIKVELDLDEKEKPDRVANEICRMIRKVYGVRSAEVSSIVEKD